MFSVERNLRGHHGVVSSLDFSPNMKQLVSSSNDKSLILWGLQTKMKAYRLVFLSSHQDLSSTYFVDIPFRVGLLS